MGQISRIFSGLELLVFVHNCKHGGVDGGWNLFAILVSGFAAMGRCVDLLNHNHGDKFNHGQRVWRNRILDGADKNFGNYFYDSFGLVLNFYRRSPVP